MKIISGVSVIFDWGSNDRGLSSGTFSQADVVDGYGLRLNEELEYENVRAYPIDTRRPPIRTEADRLTEVPDGFIPVFLSCDWHARKREVNTSSVEYSGDLYKLADALCFTMAQWGHAYVFGHRVLRPVAVADQTKAHIRIKPFALNGPSADEYMKRLDRLGEDIGRTIGEYLRERGEGIRR